MVAYCERGRGCEFWLSALTPEEADVVLDTYGLIAKNPKGTVVMVKKNSSFNFEYVDTKRSLKEIDRIYGGGGNDTIVLFPLSSSVVQPEDGIWTVKIGVPTFNASCPKLLKAQLAKVLADEMKTIPQSGRKVFSKPFKPSDLLDSSQIVWAKRSANQYRAMLRFKNQVMTFWIDYNIKSPRSIAVTNTARLMIPTLGTCIQTLAYTFTKK
ncbi:MAG: hypothetical protein ACK41E_11375, partial [Deinococcales bacterium]